MQVHCSKFAEKIAHAYKSSINQMFCQKVINISPTYNHPTPDASIHFRVYTNIAAIVNIYMCCRCAHVRFRKYDFLWNMVKKVS